MGVNGLWTVLQPCARPTNLATLNRKRLAVDASIWIYQFLKAVRDKEGNALRNSHVVGFFRRVCKLLWFGIQPVFVFDGGAPALKRATLQGRRRRREGRRDDAARTAGKILAVQMQKAAQAEEEEERRTRRGGAGPTPVVEPGSEIPNMEDIVYADELGMSRQERQRNRTFRKQDAYHLPELVNGIEGMARPEDPRIMSIDELEEYARQFNNGEDINLYDFSKIDFNGEFFKSLPPADRYHILNAARIRSRLRMGLSRDQLDGMFPDRMAFSRFQIERVKERNHLTQRLMYEMGMSGTDLTMNVNARIAGDRDREYILVKNEGAEGGWALGVVSKEKDRGEEHKPIDVDALDFQYQAKDEEDGWEDEEDFEDVPIEGVNRLPKLPPADTSVAYQRAQDAGLARRQLYDSKRGENKVADDADDEDDADESLFVDDGNTDDLFGTDQQILEGDEDEDLNRAIAMSLQNQHGFGAVAGGEENGDSEERPAPKWKQKAAEAPRPITGTNGLVVAHVVNNRANATVTRRDSAASSDSDMDLQAALASARKKQLAAPKPTEKPPTPAKTDPPFSGPLPFEKLDWKSSIFAAAKKPGIAEETRPRATEAGGFVVESDEESAGGFEREPTKEKEDAPRPLPPWLADETDIRESVRSRQEMNMGMNMEDEEEARQRDLFAQRQREEEVMVIDSSEGEDSDIEVIDAIPQPEHEQFEAAPPAPTAETIAGTGAVEPGHSGHSLEITVAQDKRPVVDSDGQIQTAEQVSRFPSPDVEFEDVQIATVTEGDGAGGDARTSSHVEEKPEEAHEDFPPPLAQQERVEGLASTEDLFADAPGEDEFEDPSDIEEEELMVQMAQEAEEHARFASQLNNKSERENQEDYERELRSLRTQQKKDRRDADEVTQIMVTECQALLRLFGIPYITAPMEAEAQCAKLVHLGLVDGIVTDDSDTFLFGGTRVYKNMFNSNKLVECYLGSDLDQELSLSRESLVSIAQLLGSDYTDGLPGIGPVTAVEILSEFPGTDGLREFKEWWQDVQMNNRPKSADADSPFRRKFRKSQATKLFLPPSFPNPAVGEAYLNAEVDDSTEPFQWGVPNLEGLRQFLMNTIGWSQERTDEVLVPVIKDMNRRDAEGTQSNITRFFQGGVGVGAKEAFAPHRRAKGSKRMTDAVNRLRAKAGSGPLTDPPSAAPPSSARKGRKRKARGREPTPIEVDGGEEDVDTSGANSQGDDGRLTEQGSSSSATKSIPKGKRSKVSV